MLKVLGVGFGLAVAVGNTIGAGIFRTPGQIAEQVPHPWLFLGIWLAGGLYALLGAISIAELGTMIPRHCKTAKTIATVAAIAGLQPLNAGKSAPENVPTTSATAAVEPHVEIQSLQPTMNPAYSPSA